MTTAALVLAAGGSSRMGRPKQLLPFHGRTLVRHTAAVGLAAGCDPVVVVLGAGADQVSPELAGVPVTVVVNPDWQRGPGTSLRVGVEALPDRVTSVVVLLADQPFVGAAHVRRLGDALAETGRPMAASGYSGSIGVPALFTRECFPALLALGPEAGAKKLLVQAPDRVAVVPFPAGAIDLDTPAEYERALTSPAPPTEEFHDRGQ